MKNLTLHNFRGFEYLSWNFTPRINLIVGDNASGKTSLLRACRLVAGSFFSGFSDENTVWPGPEAGDFRETIENGMISPYKPVEIGFFLNQATFPNVAMSLIKNGTANDRKIFNPADESYWILKKSPKNSKQLSSGLSDFKSYSKVVYNNSDKPIQLPLFAFFSTEDIHSSRKIDSQKFRKEFLKRSFGYYTCLDSNGLLTYWERRLLVLQEAQDDSVEVREVRRIMLKILSEEGCGILEDIVIRPMRGKVYYKLSDGRLTDSATISDGYKRLINIAINLAFRAYILNNMVFGEGVEEKTTGIVMLDEIDLHLHPSLQVKALPALSATFPNIQFIATSHSPLVMSSVRNGENDSVTKIDYMPDGGYHHYRINTYGNDASTIMTDILEVAERDINVKHDLDALFDKIDNEDYEAARIEFLRLKKIYGELPELARAGVTLDFLAPEI